MKKLKKLPKITGDIPLVYSRTSIYTICTLINALVDYVEHLAKEIEELKRSDNNG